MASLYNVENLELDDLFFLFVCLNHELLSKTFTSFFKKNYSFTPIQMGALAYLKAHSGLTMTILASKLHISKQQATQLVSSLVSRDLVCREYDSDNRRIITIIPTQKTIDIFNDGEDIYLSHAMNQLAKLTARERRETFKAIKTLIRILPKCDFNPNPLEEI